MGKIRILFCFLCILGIVLTGCGSKDVDISDSGDDHFIKVYFTNEEGDRLLYEERRESEEKDNQSKVEDLIDWMLEDPEEEDHFVAIPSEVIINNVVARNNVVNIDFAVGYESMDKAEDVICRAAIVNTLIQIKGIDYVEFTIGGKTMMDYNNNPIGSLTDESFVFGELPMKEE